MLNTYIYHKLPLTRFGVCYTIFRETQRYKIHRDFEQVTQLSP